MESLGQWRDSQRLKKPTPAMKTPLLLLAVAGVTVSGCSKKQPDAARSDAPPPPEAAPAVVTPAPVVENAPDLQAINQALKAYAREKKRVPLNLDELVAAGYLRKAPQPPRDKRFAIDPQTMEVRVESYRVGF
jgi:hypothetical protein